MTKEQEQELEREFNEKYADYIKEIEERNFLRRKRYEIEQLKRDGRHGLGLTTTKLLSYYLFIIFNIVLIYTLVAMWHFGDLTYLNVIITDIVAQILVYGIYCIRAYKDTQSEENIKLERDKLDNTPYNIKEKIENIFDKLEALGIVDNNECKCSDPIEEKSEMEYKETDKSNSDEQNI